MNKPIDFVGILEPEPCGVTWKRYLANCPITHTNLSASGVQPAAGKCSCNLYSGHVGPHVCLCGASTPDTYKGGT